MPERGHASAAATHSAPIDHRDLATMQPSGNPSSQGPNVGDKRAAPPHWAGQPAVPGGSAGLASRAANVVQRTIGSGSAGAGGSAAYGKAATAGTNGDRKPCGCKNSKCLKLYCDCFAIGEYCKGCLCTGCHNNPAFEVRTRCAWSKRVCREIFEKERGFRDQRTANCVANKGPPSVLFWRGLRGCTSTLAAHARRFETVSN